MSIERPNYETPQTLPIKGEVSPESMPEYLRQQFESPEKLDLYGGETLSIRDIQPEKLKTEIPTLVAKGWGVTNEDNHRRNIIGLAEKGRRVLAVDNIYGISSEQVDDTERAKELVPDELMLDKVAAILKVFELKEGLDRIDVVAHSEGAIHVIYAALLHPEKFRNLVLVNPAGMIGESTVSRIAKGAVVDIGIQMYKAIKNEGLNAHKLIKGETRGLVKSITANPIKSGISMGELAKTQIHELIEAVRERGVRVSIIHGVDDRFFPMEDVQKMTKDGTVDGFYSVKIRDDDQPSGHNLLRTKPDRFNNIIDSALDALEKLHEKEAEVVKE